MKGLYLHQVVVCKRPLETLHDDIIDAVLLRVRSREGRYE
jgi:hypothetical protein